MAGQTLPKFSTADNPVYYYVQFKAGGAYLADMGQGANLRTANKTNTDAQKWAFIGTKDDFRLLCKTGRYAGFSGSFFTATAAGASLKLVASTNASASGYWEIQRKTSSQSMNQYQGTGAGRQLGEWEAGDANNPVSFTPASAILPDFSDEDTEQYYFLQFCISGQTLEDRGAGRSVTFGDADPTDGQLWKLVGTPQNFQLVSKAGRYAYIDGASASASSASDNARLKTRTTPDDKGFSLKETGNSSYLTNWEIQWNGSNGSRTSFNRWGGGELPASEIGLWSANDANNPIRFIIPDDMTYADYQVEGAAGYTPEHLQTLWYTQPATLTSSANKWMEYSLPLGNGQLGASLFGGVYRDEILFNEKTIWTGRNALSSYGGGGYGSYQYFGSIFAEDLSGTFSFGSARPVKEYVRQLDLSNATGAVMFADADGVRYKREYISSYPAQAIVVRYSASEAGKLSMRFTLQSGVDGRPATTYADGEASFHKKLDLVTCDARLKVIPTGGTMETAGGGIEVRGADEILLVLCGGSDYDLSSASYVSGTAQLASKIKDAVTAAAAKGWESLYAEHVADYQHLFDRVDLQFDGAQNTLPTDQLVDAYGRTGSSTSSATTLMLEKLYFDYGRYLEIASSRGVDVPSNLQGIWNNSPTPPWNADIHANINVQMNYWPAEPTNLSETHLPFLNHIISLATEHKEWQDYAKRSGQTVGWTFYTENNIFGGGSPWSDNYTIANAWYVTHLWQHYRYTLDRDFLKRAFPAMWTCSKYWMERMVKAADGTYECPNEYSPEHGPQSQNATAHSQQLVIELFQNTKDAADILGDEAGLRPAELTRLTDYLEHSDKGLAIEQYTGAWGNPQNGVRSGTDILREWKYSAYNVGENNHRHQSHLMCLYPFAQVTPSSPYFQAAVNSLKLRSDNSTGWSMGWRINLWARAQDGDHAHVLLHSALKHSTSYGTNQNAGGIYYNLYDSHSPFQIDGNFGACAGIAEMLMQSATDTIQLLPALPKVWKTGSVKGLKAVGGFVVSIEWSKNKPVRAVIENPLGTEAPAVYGKYLIPVNSEKGSTTVIDFDENGVPITGVSSVQADLRQEIAVSGNTVTVRSADMECVSVYDLQGRLLMETTKRSFSLPAAAGTLLLAVRATDGTVQSHKLAR
ncbi:MAG: glycoside hydrolase family 95 protein [Alloprevotella sp.]|nr:glycoside hydrolase family 95 protein [Alloprevotella sp.]